jgi:hypothetical protein
VPRAWSATMREIRPGAYGPPPSPRNRTPRWVGRHFASSALHQ